MHLKTSLSGGSLYSAAGQRKYLSASERSRFIAASLACLRPELTSLCLVLAYTGCRISEALALRAGSVDMDEGSVAIRSLKKRSHAVIVREIPIPPLCVRTLCKVHGLAHAPPETRLWPWSRSRAWQLVKSVMDEAGIAKGIHATPKGLRHGFGLHAVRSGVPLNLIQRWLGHASMTTTAIYLQAMGVEEREIAARMWNEADSGLTFPERAATAA
ncbi:tyrosine-type recombinase/integrase [Bradyrhizobium liaoningense]